ncbi:MAG: serine protease [Verrucomicrobiales bacterium]|nr:serine protease [Verrucomicrobiales bacterium]
MKLGRLFTLLFLITFSFSGLSLSQEDDAAKARELLEKYKASLVVITVKGKLIATTSGDPLPEREQQRRTLGVTIGDDGLVVVSNSAIDASLGLAGQQAKMESNVVTIKTAKSEFTDVEISYGDSSLLHGKVVRQDPEADIAFIMPDSAEAKALNKTFSYVDLSQFAATAQEADKVVGLSRSSAVYGYMPTVVMGRVTGVYKGDRTFFVTDAGTAQGIPVFTLEGKPVGLTVVRIIDGNPSGVLGTLSAGSIQVMANLAREAAK